MPSNPQLLPNGVYKFTVSDGDRSLSPSGVKPGTGAGTQLVMLTEEEGTAEGFNWKLSYEPSQAAYTIQHAKSGLFFSFEGSAKENAHLGAHAKPKYFAIEQQGGNTYRIQLKDSNLSVNMSPLMMYPPMIALQSESSLVAQLTWKLRPM
ncbi:hypothetical protein BDV93DRAFT_527103 [Ceratobasidium sp. AG-I]|nr:hypothetical protein BDV93DRAFT_527103 [Ceratobasidium sp. AG-I]